MGQRLTLLLLTALLCGAVSAQKNDRRGSNGNTIALDQLAGGIYTAMVTTVAGLFVGIVAYFGYNYLVMRVDKIMHNLEARNVEFLDMLNEPAAK